MSTREILVPNSNQDPYEYENPQDLYAARMGLWFETPNAPESPLQALMETQPGNTPEKSRIEIQKVREAVADCIAALSAKDQFIVNARDMEGLSYRKLAVRLGCSKSQAEREHKLAYTQLTQFLKSHPHILESYPAMQPTTWNQAAENAVYMIHMKSVTTLPLPFDEGIRRGKAMLASGWENIPALTDVLTEIGASAFGALDQMDEDGELIQEVIDLLVDRHHKYGPNNINEFVQYGLLVRMSDKVARIKNSGGQDFADETYRDAYLDLIGYAAIAHMLEQGTFGLELEA